jgi:hypothetical protein
MHCQVLFLQISLVCVLGQRHQAGCVTQILGCVVPFVLFSTGSQHETDNQTKGRNPRHRAITHRYRHQRLDFSSSFSDSGRPD